MNNKLIKNSTLTPVSFDNPYQHLTDAQKALLELFVQSVKTKMPVTRDQILEIFIKHVKKKETYTYHKYHYSFILMKRVYTGETEERKWRELYDIKGMAYQWFKINLGAVIIKGKLLVIPIIETD